MSRKIFNDDALDAEFARSGYIVIDAIPTERCKELYSQVKALDSHVDATFYTSLWSSDAEYKRKANQIIFGELEGFAAKVFHNYRPLFGDLLVKRPSLFKDFALHQDWTFVDESQYSSIYIWVPLQDVNYINGYLQVVRGSHRILDKVRGANVKVSYEDIKPQIAKHHLEGVKLRAGQAIIFSQALLHASPPNRSLNTRIAMGLLMVPKEADLFHYVYDKQGNTLYKLKVDVDFFLNYSNHIDFSASLEGSAFKLPEGSTVIETTTPTTVEMDYTTFINKYKQVAV